MKTLSKLPRFAARAALGATTALPLLTLLVPRVAHAQYVYVAPPPPPPPPPPPGYRYYENRDAWERRGSALDLGIDLEGAVPVNGGVLPDGNQLQGGSGIKLRVGDQLRVTPSFRITVEGGYAYAHLWASDSYGDAFAWDTDRLFGGVRLAFGTILVPSIYGHLGVGWRMTSDPTVPAAAGFAADAGGALDVRLWRHFQFGAHAEYATLDTTPYAPQWVAMGMHVDFVL